MALSTFNVSDIIWKVADAENINVDISGIDDLCYGLVLSADKSFADFLNQHRGPYNFQVIDGDPIRIVRRQVNDALAIDFTISQSDCLPPSDGQPSVQFSRTDPETLPGEIQLAYIDVNRSFAINVQSAKHRHGKKFANKVTDAIAHFGDPTSTRSRLLTTVQVDFILDENKARALAFDYLYRTWSQATSCQFEHPDLRIEAGDTILLNSDSGQFTLLVQESTLTKRKTNQLKATVLLTSTGFVVPITGGFSAPISGGQADTYSTFADDDFASWLVSI